MRILYLHQHFTVRSGTAGGRSYEFSRLLVTRGHQVTLITGAYDRSGLEPPRRGLVHRLEVDGIEVLVLNVPYRQGMSMAKRIAAFLEFVMLASWTALRVERPDVVFATSTPLTIAIPGMLAACRHRAPFVFEVRDLWPAVPIEMGLLRNPLVKLAARWLERTAYRRARKIVALSPGMKAGIVAGGVPPERVTVIPNSSDLELFRVDAAKGREYRTEHPELGDRPLLVYAGAFGRVNNLDYVIDLAARIAALEPRIAMLLVGDGSEKPRLMAASDAAGLTGRTLFFRDPVQRTELARIFSAATVLSSFVLPLPLMETNSANKFFDAFAAGKPVVINHGGWQAELLERTGAGLVLDARDVDGSARRLTAAMTDPVWLAGAEAASRRLGEEEFDRRRLAGELEGVLAAACHG